MPKRAPNISRRKFLGQASCAGVGSASLFSTLLNLRMANSAAAQSLPVIDPFEYRGLVCLFLAGGNDSYNMLVPKGDTEYDAYAAIRSDLALPKEDLLTINDIGGLELGVHPSMPEVQSLFESQRLAFVSNVGTLVEPTTLSGYNNGTTPLPRGLFSHSDQVEQWQTSIPDSATGFGWGGRTADLLHSLNDNDKISMSISLNGTNVWQNGHDTAQYQITKNGSIARTYYDSAPGTEDDWNRMTGAAIKSQIDQQYSNLFDQTFANISRGAIDAHENFSSATGAVTTFTSTVHTDSGTDTADEIASINSLAQYFEMVAKTIAAQGTLGLRRQTFFINVGGWDHHDEVIDTQASMLKVISRCLAYFNDLMVEISMDDKVTLFTASDFARTLTSNGRGSDHAWGGNQIVMGGAVKGQKVYGNYPDLYSGNTLDTGRGRLIPTLSVDEYFAELAAWLGVQTSDLTTVLPNLDRFYTPGPTAPVGFLL
ncbi:MAG: DUF1501 domain-containing protein [Opitutaceae bacterium]